MKAISLPSEQGYGSPAPLAIPSTSSWSTSEPTGQSKGVSESDRALRNRKYEIYRDLSASFAISSIMARSKGLGGLAFELVEHTDNEAPGTVKETASDPNYSSFVSKTTAALAEEPLEDGCNHLVFKIFENAIALFEEGTILWIVDMLERDDTAAESAALLICTATTETELSTEQKSQLLKAGLASKHATVRDAALQAAEHWDDSALASILASHCEEVGWLSDYKDEVLADLGPANTHNK